MKPDAVDALVEAAITRGARRNDLEHMLGVGLAGHSAGVGLRPVPGDRVEQTAPEPPRPLMREPPAADPFPIDELGDVLAPAARAIHDRVQAPLAICGQAVLAIATLAVQAQADVELPTQQVRPLTNYFLTKCYWMGP
jgi:hypothetical protein